MTYHDRSILRLIDANLNRAIEGIRVLEECARMLFDDAPLTHELKTLRHSLLSIFSVDESLRTSLVLSRASDRDVLRNGETPSEGQRRGLSDLVRANASRAREAMRNIEEYGKLIDPGISLRCKEIRFRLYDTEKALIARIRKTERASADRLRLVAILDPTDSADPRGMVSRLAGAGAGVIVYRDNRSSDIKRMNNFEGLMDGIRGTGVTVLGWDRADIALASGADGVLLSHEGITVAAVRAISPPSWIVGRTVTCPGIDLGSTVDDTADFVLIDQNHNNPESFSAPEDLKASIDAIPAPVVAASPPDEDYVSDLFDIGADGVAIVTKKPDTDIIRKLRTLVDRLASDRG